MAKIHIGIGLVKSGYEGNSPFFDVIKFGLGLSGTVAIVAGIWKSIDFYFWKKTKKFNKEHFKSESSKSVVEEVVFKAPTPVTLNQTLSLPRPDFSALSLWGKLLLMGDSLILYSSDGQGKSTLAMQGCIDIANGSRVLFLPLEETPHAPKKQTVYYYDAELTNDDIQMRYGAEGNVFPDNLYRISDTFNSVDELFKDIENRISLNEDCTICIDNLSGILPVSSPTLARDFFIRQKAIKDKALANEHRLTFITVTHTPKTKPGEVNEQFYGSAHIGNLAATRIGFFPTCAGDDYKMIKVEKNRKFQKGDKVIVVKRVSEPYPHFEFDCYLDFEDVEPKNGTYNPDGSIAKVMPKAPAPNQKVTQEMEEKIKEMLEGNVKPKIIAKKFKLSEKTIRRYRKDWGYAA